jgi:CheY-like chemotaxis protein
MKKILLVDDVELNNFLTSVYLKQICNEIEIDFATDGIKALEKGDLKKYDIIFMDIQMPNMDGIEATKKIREKEGINKNTPICFLTAHIEESTKKACFEAGGNEFIAKPISKSDIFEVFTKFNLK